MPPETKKPRPIWQDDPRGPVKVIDQRRLPHERVEAELRTVDDAIYAIQTLMVRGAPLIGVTAAYGVFLAAAAAAENGGGRDYIEAEAARLETEHGDPARAAMLRAEVAANREVNGL